MSETAGSLFRLVLATAVDKARGTFYFGQCAVVKTLCTVTNGTRSEKGTVYMNVETAKQGATLRTHGQHGSDMGK